MKAVLSLEIIADNYFALQSAKAKGEVDPSLAARQLARYERLLGRDPIRPWVAALDGLDPKYGFQRRFMKGQRDYAGANGVGSRGVYEYYPLDDGIYEVHARVTWKKTRRYFVRVASGQIEEISRSEVIACLESKG